MNLKILLIGMPGCGKTSLGKRAAKSLDFSFVDLDEEIEKSQNKSINDIFTENGEEYFRRLETEKLKEFCSVPQNKDIIISTGGGVVKNNINIENAKFLGGYIIFIDRPLNFIMEDVDTSDRPLLKDGADKLISLYSERYELYRDAADYIITNNMSFAEVLKEIIGIDINSKSQLLKLFQDYEEAKTEYDQIKGALKMVKATGYGVASPSLADMKLDTPEIIKQGGRFGVKLKAVAPSIHMIRVDVESTFEPIIGSEIQSKELINYLMKDSVIIRNY